MFSLQCDKLASNFFGSIVSHMVDSGLIIQSNIQGLVGSVSTWATASISMGEGQSPNHFILRNAGRVGQFVVQKVNLL